jgi:hypothetical protein
MTERGLTTLENVKTVYFVGIGGIGMSAIARYFIQEAYKLVVTTEPVQLLHRNWKEKVLPSITMKMLMAFRKMLTW